MTRSTYIALSESDAVLTFCPHVMRAETATFDVATVNPKCVNDSITMPPDYVRRGHGIHTNIDRAAAAELRDALNDWLESAPASAAPTIEEPA